MKTRIAWIQIGEWDEGDVIPILGDTDITFDEPAGYELGLIWQKVVVIPIEEDDQ